MNFVIVEKIHCTVVVLNTFSALKLLGGWQQGRSRTSCTSVSWLNVSRRIEMKLVLDRPLVAGKASG